ncbi:hypothetical protein BT69DRAFT_1348096 [Atractiella rhizophila]|nr:hypothetical protein BT69DRAFT_1348096 [Atractiella rhizophila]
MQVTGDDMIEYDELEASTPYVPWKSCFLSFASRRSEESRLSLLAFPFRFLDLPVEIQIDILRTLHTPPSIRSPPFSNANLLALSVVSNYMRVLVVPFLFQELFLPTWKEDEEDPIEPLSAILPSNCVLAARFLTVTLRDFHLHHPERLLRQSFAVLTFPANHIQSVRLLVETEFQHSLESYLDATKRVHYLFDHICLSLTSAPSVCELQLELLGRWLSFGFFNGTLERLNTSNSITNLMLRGHYLYGSGGVVSCFPSLRHLRLDSSGSLDKCFTPDLQLPPIESLEIVSTFHNKNHRGRELIWARVYRILSPFAASLQRLSIQRIFQLSEVDAACDYPELPNLRTLELTNTATLVHLFPPIDWTLGQDCFATSPASTLFLDQVPSDNPNPDLHTAWNTTFSSRPQSLGFHFSPLGDISFQFWEYAMHVLAHEKRVGRWQALERLRFGPYASKILLSDEDVAIKCFDVLKDLGISVTTYAEPEIPSKG